MTAHGPAATPAPAPSELFREQLEGLRSWALLALAHDGAQRSRLTGRLGEMLESAVTAAACGVDEGAWSQASPALALREAGIAASPAERAELLRAARVLGSLAPGEEAERALLRVAVRLAESLLHTLDLADAEASVEDFHLPPRAELNALLEASRERLNRTRTRTGTSPFVARSIRRLEELGVGGRVPRYVVRDTAGNEVHSDDFSGKVTLYRVWDASSPASIRAHQRDAQLQRRFWDLPFELVGITANEDRQEHLDRLEGLGLAGTQLYDGPIGTALVDALARSGEVARATPAGALEAWARPSPGAVILVDSRGVIRGRDLGHGELERRIQELVSEHHLRLREQRLTPGR